MNEEHWYHALINDWYPLINSAPLSSTQQYVIDCVDDIFKINNKLVSSTNGWVRIRFRVNDELTIRIELPPDPGFDEIAYSFETYDTLRETSNAIYLNELGLITYLYSLKEIIGGL